MVNSALMPPVDLRLDPEVALAIGYAPAAVRAALTALWAFDAQLASILRTTSDPMIGQLRLTWWHDAVAGHAVHGQPLLAALRAGGFPTQNLQRVVEGWEALLDAPDDDALRTYAEGRGVGLFTAAAAVLRTTEPMADAGAGWALIDLARHHSRLDVTARALTMARTRLADAPRRWARGGRTLGALTKLARRDLAGPEPRGSPRRVLAAAWLALTGR